MDWVARMPIWGGHNFGSSAATGLPELGIPSRRRPPPQLEGLRQGLSFEIGPKSNCLGHAQGAKSWKPQDLPPPTSPATPWESEDLIHGGGGRAAWRTGTRSGGCFSLADFLGVVVGGPQSGGSLWLVPYGVMLAGLTILTTNMFRTIWRATRRRSAIRARLQIDGEEPPATTRAVTGGIWLGLLIGTLIGVWLYAL